MVGGFGRGGQKGEEGEKCMCVLMSYCVTGSKTDTEDFQEAVLKGCSEVWYLLRRRQENGGYGVGYILFLDTPFQKL